MSVTLSNHHHCRIQLYINKHTRLSWRPWLRNAKSCWLPLTVEERAKVPWIECIFQSLPSCCLGESMWNGDYLGDKRKPNQENGKDGILGPINSPWKLVSWRWAGYTMVLSASSPAGIIRSINSPKILWAEWPLSPHNTPKPRARLPWRGGMLAAEMQCCYHVATSRMP